MERVWVEQACLAEGPGRQSVEGRPRRLGVTWCGDRDCTGPHTCKKCRAVYAKQARAKGRFSGPRDMSVKRAKSRLLMRFRRGTEVRPPCICEGCQQTATFVRFTELQPMRYSMACKAHRELLP